MNVCVDSFGSLALRHNHSVMTMQQIEAIAQLEEMTLHVLVDQSLGEKGMQMHQGQKFFHTVNGRVNGQPKGLKSFLEAQHMDIYHCLNQGMSAPCMTTVPVIASITHDLPRSHPMYCAPSYCALYEKSIRALQVRGAHYMATSGVLKEALINAYGIEEERIHVVAPFVNPFYRPISHTISRSYIRQKYGLEEGYLLSVMDVYESHQIIPLLESFKMLRMKAPYLKLVLLFYITPMYQVYYKEVMRHITRLGLGRCVVVITRFTKEDQRHFYNDAQCLLDFSLGNKVNMSMLEAASCGCGILAQDTVLHRELLGAYGHYIEDVMELSLCQSWIEGTGQGGSCEQWQRYDRKQQQQQLQAVYTKCYE